MTAPTQPLEPRRVGYVLMDVCPCGKHLKCARAPRCKFCRQQRASALALAKRRAQ